MTSRWVEEYLVDAEFALLARYRYLNHLLLSSKLYEDYEVVDQTHNKNVRRNG